MKTECKKCLKRKTDAWKVPGREPGIGNALYNYYWHGWATVPFPRGDGGRIPQREVNWVSDSLFLTFESLQALCEGIMPWFDVTEFFLQAHWNRGWVEKAKSFTPRKIWLNWMVRSRDGVQGRKSCDKEVGMRWWSLGGREGNQRIVSWESGGQG